MNVSCPECSTIYRVDPAKVPLGGVRARCSACGGVIPVGMTGGATHSGSDTSHAGLSRPAAAPPFASPGASLPPMRQTPRAPWPAAGGLTPAAAAPPVVAPQPQQTERATIPTPPAPQRVTPQRVTPVSVPSFTPPSLSVPPVTPPSTSPLSPSSPPSPPPVSPGERRPINPFLSRDPGLRAKRLSRALVSDMVAYYPAKHSEGLEKGTLKELFREEIKKSYDEYVAQVGSEVARSTTHFQESLNEVLGAGRKIF